MYVELQIPLGSFRTLSKPSCLLGGVRCCSSARNTGCSFGNPLIKTLSPLTQRSNQNNDYKMFVLSEPKSHATLACRQREHAGA